MDKTKFVINAHMDWDYLGNYFNYESDDSEFIDPLWICDEIPFSEPGWPQRFFIVGKAGPAFNLGIAEKPHSIPALKGEGASKTLKL